MTGKYYWSSINLFYFYIFPDTVLAYNLEKCLHLVVIPRITTKQLTHGCRHLYFWHIGPQCDGSQSNPCFLYSYRQISWIIQDNWPQIQHYLSPKWRNIPNICNNWNLFLSCLTILFVESKPTPNIWDWTPILQQISQIIQSIHCSYRHLLNWQCWDQY